MTGRKRHILVDTLGLLISVWVGPASDHDQRGAKRLLAGLKPFQPRLAVVHADGAYAGNKLAAWCSEPAGVELRVVRRRERHHFEVLPKRWIVERTFAWLGRNRRLARDYEGRVQTTAPLVKVAMVSLMLRRLAPCNRARETPSKTWGAGGVEAPAAPRAAPPAFLVTPCRTAAP